MHHLIVDQVFNYASKRPKKVVRLTLYTLKVYNRNAIFLF